MFQRRPDSQTWPCEEAIQLQFFSSGEVAWAIQPANVTQRKFLRNCNCRDHRVLQGAPPRGRQLYFNFPSAPDPLFKASKAPFLTLRVATPSGAPRQALLEKMCALMVPPAVPANRSYSPQVIRCAGLSPQMLLESLGAPLPLLRPSIQSPSH